MKNISVVMSHENKEMFIRSQQFKTTGSRGVFSREVLDSFVSVNNDRESLLAAAQRLRPDVLLLDMFVSGGDAVTLIRQLRQRMGEEAPRFVVICEFPAMRLERELYGVGAWIVMNRPVCVEALYNVLRSLEHDAPEGESLTEAENHRELELVVTDIMHQIGVPAHIKGYNFTRCAIMLTVERPELLGGVTTRMYPIIAEKYHSTPSRVERAIRHAIEMAWDRGNVDVLNAYFGFTINNGKGKPTNSEFIAMIADKLRLEAVVTPTV